MCTVALTVASALGSLYQGYTQKQYADAQAKAAEVNARIAEQQGHDAITRGGVREGQMRRQLQKLIGAQRANAAAAGIAVDSGSVTDARMSSIDAMERDIDVNEMNAQREKWGYDVQATNYMNQASAARAAGSNAMTAGIIGAGTSLLSLAAPRIDEWFSKGTGGGALYGEHSMANLTANQAAGQVGTNTAQTIWPGKTLYEKYGYTPYAANFDATSFGAGSGASSGGQLFVGPPIPGYGPSYGKSNTMSWDNWLMGRKR